MEFYKETEFRDTDIGRIPKDWNIESIKNIADVKGGKRLPKGDKLVDYKTPYPYIRILDFAEGKINVDDIKFLLPSTHKKISRYIISSEDVYISIAGTIGLAGLIPKELDGINLTENAAKLCNLRKIEKVFLAYQLNSAILQSQIKALIGKGSQPKLALFRIEKLLIPFPSYLEQNKICQILKRIASLIQQTDSIIQKTKKLKKGLMQELLTKGIGHKEFKYSEELGYEIPKEWDVLKLVNIVNNEDDIVAGPFGSNLKVCDYKPEGIPIIRLQNIERNKFIEKNMKYISEHKAQELKYHSFLAGDIVLAKLGDPLGKTCLIPEGIDRGIVVADVVRIRVAPEKAEKKFIVHVLNSEMSALQLSKNTIGSTRPRVNISQIRELKIPYPLIQEQQKIAQILTRIDESLENESQTKEYLEILKKALMQSLLTGQVRIKVN